MSKMTACALDDMEYIMFQKKTVLAPRIPLVIDQLKLKVLAFFKSISRDSISKPTRPNLPWYLETSYSSTGLARQKTAVTQSSMSNHAVPIEEFSSKIKQIHFWYFWEKQVSLMEFIQMSMGKQNLEEFFFICVSYLDLNFTLLLALM